MYKKTVALVLGVVLISGASGCSFLIRKREKEPSLAPEKIWMTKIESAGGVLDVGKTYVYKVHWLGLTVGDASLQVKEKISSEQGELYHVILSAATNNFFSLFYNVKGTVESFVRVEDFKSIKYDSQTHINKKFVFKKMEYDYENMVVRAEDKKGKYELKIKDKVLDPLGIFYYFIANPVLINKPIDIFLNAGKKNYDVTVFVKNGRRLKVPAGVFWAFQVEPTVQSERQFDDALNSPGSMSIWFSSDQQRIPLIVILKIPLGTAQAILTKIETAESELTGND